MTKQELIARLQAFPDGAQVFVWNPWSVDFDPVTDIDVDFEDNPVIVARD